MEGLQASATKASALLDTLVLRVMRRARMFRDPAPTLDEARLYLDPAMLESAERFYRRPPEHVLAELRRVDGVRHRLRFASEYPTFDPGYQAELDALAENRTVHVEAWLHETPRPAVIALHPWFSGFAALDAQIFAARRLYRRGLDVYLMTLPFHGARTAPGRLSGWHFVPPSVRRATEASGQMVWDARRLFRWIRRRGSEQVGVVGASLGGGATAMLAALEPNLAFAIPVLPLVSIGEMIARGQDAPAEARPGLLKAFALTSALSFPCALPRERVLLVGGRGDRIISPEHVTALWRHWGFPKMHWTDGGHILHFGREDALRAMDAHLDALGIGVPASEPSARRNPRAA